MADFVASVLAQPIDSALRYVGALIKRQCIYLFCFSSNITALENEEENLETKIEGVQLQVNAANDNGEDTHPEVASWLIKSDNLKEKVKDILDKARNVESGCLRVAPRFTQSKRAKKTTKAMAQHREKGSFKNISVPPPSAASKAIPLGLTYEFDSRKRVEEDIMETLRGKDVNTIGICGMGGLGKTVMVKRIANRALEEHLFDEIATTVVSQQIDELKIQLDIGGSLGLKGLKEEAPQARVQKLHARLTGAKRILLVVDDVWKSFALEALGIPCESGGKGCTILLTSRNKDVLAEMNVQNKDVRGLQILSDEEAWFLFKKKAGTCVDDPKLNPIARDVVQECKGLPIALATLGAALKDKTPKIWSNARRQLRNSNPVDLPSVIENVYQHLRLSYDLLGSDDAQSLFLLCCLFPEDYDIPQLRMISARNKIMHLRLEEGTCLGHWIEKKLLRDTEYLYLIGSGANNLGLSKCPNIQCLELGECETIKNIATTSSTDDGLVFPALTNLQLFSLLGLEEIWDGPISSNSFLNLKELELLELPSLKQLWKGNYVSLFTNLSSIYISGCPFLQNLGQLSMAGKDCLSQLQYLRIVECEMLKQVFVWNEVEENQKSRHVTKIFPKLERVQLRALRNLTTFYQGIETIEFPLLTSMSIDKCPEMRSIISTANLGDVHHSSHLFCQPQNVSFGSSLKIINSDLNPFCGHEIPVSLYEGLEKLIIFEYRGNMSLFSSSTAVNLVSLKLLCIRRCDEMIRVINDDASGSGGERPLLVFPKLQALELKELRKLVTFCKWKCDVELPSLRMVVIKTCPNMKSFTLGSLTTPNLEKIEIQSTSCGVTKGIDGALQEYLVMAGEKQRDGAEQEIEEEPDS